MTEPLWIDLLDPDRETLDRAIEGEVHPSALTRLQARSTIAGEPRPRLESHGNHVFGVLIAPLFVPDDSRVVYQEVDVVVSIDRIVTVRKTPEGGQPFGIDDVRKTALAAGDSPGQCLYYLFDEIAEKYLTLVDALDEDVDELEDRVQAGPGATQVRERISRLRHNILHVRRGLVPTRDAARLVLDNRVDLEGDRELFPRDVEIHFADAYDKLLRATDGLELSRDLLAGVRDFQQAQIAVDQNEVVKRLTVVASVLLLPTFIVGMYGQNLKGVPEFGFRYGYAWSWFLIVITTAAQLAYFRRKRWI
jgi:magnesium transporter